MTAETIAYNILKDILPDKVFPIHAAQATSYPFIVYGRISTIVNNTLCGDTGYSRARIQVDIKSDTYKEVIALAVQVRGAFSSNESATMDNRNDLSDPENNTYWITMDFSIFEKGI